MKYFSKGPVIHILIMMILVICFVEALEENPAFRFSSIQRRKRFLRRSCHDLRLICPTQEKHFVVRSSWRGWFRGCEFELEGSSILDKILKECNNSIMDQCTEQWVNHEKNNNCSVPVPIAKEILDSVFYSACTLHDLCYLSLNTDRDDCDKWFLHNLKQICTISRLPCPARLMYNAVRLFGGGGFKRMHKWAKDHCSSESTGSLKGIIFEGSGLSGRFSGSGSGSGSVPEVPEIEQY